MDYNIGAIKVFARQLKNARPISPSTSITGPAMTLGTLLFQRVWLQGMLVACRENGCFVLDDGSSIIEIFLPKDFLQQQWKIGMYVMVIGAYSVGGSGSPVIKGHKIVDLSNFPDREAMWHLEVIEAYEMFYKSSMVEG
ncbi:hypothetical protein SUGI_0927420 [Cryptomeria japonica]|uniref:uncharacterized protein LOC131029814 n=1 Tax=Cryptomeria japonica TaxID=3369 RepID=UPI002414AFF9|nr:uncharacterized protein LOC131029814 [Cryptomeria japonica]GLJ44311.1 hypothetical protein SUGI_0927420 [Cryptomeria japonica]